MTDEALIRAEYSPWRADEAFEGRAQIEREADLYASGAIDEPLWAAPADIENMFSLPRRPRPPRKPRPSRAKPMRADWWTPPMPYYAPEPRLVAPRWSTVEIDEAVAAYNADLKARGLLP